MKNIVMTVPLWERDITLMLGGDYHNILEIANMNKLSKQVILEIEKDKLSTKDSEGGAYFCLDKGEGILWFPKKRVKGTILSHEATHIVDWLLEFIGAEKEMEARAYTVEWIVKNIPIYMKKLT